MTISLTLGTNTYITLEDAELYFETRLNAELWENATDDDKSKALIMATKKINKMNFIGVKKVITQTLEFPRLYEQKNTDNFPYNYLSIADYPEEIEDAVCEEALAILSFGSSTHQQNKQFGIKSISMGTESVTYDDSAVSSRALLSAEAKNMLSKWTKKSFNIC